MADEANTTQAAERLVIVGSGVAGLTAAVYAARGNLRPLVLEGAEPGGQLSLTSVVENFPGFPEGVGGYELVEAIRRQAERFGARYRAGEVRRIDFTRRPFTLHLDGEDEPLRAHSLILASGARARMLGLPGESELLGRGLSTCATCDGAFFRDQRVIVVGGGDSAMEDAIYLTKFAREVHVVHRRDRLRASKIMQDRAFAKEQIRFHWNRVPVGFLRNGDGRIVGMRLRATDRPEGEAPEEDLPADGVFYAIGHVPNTEMVGDALPRDAQGYLTPHGVCSNIPGVFVAGDVADHRYQQAATAAGTGCAAAMEAEAWLEAQGLAH
jgi:thioredoxin reductase (NADPH)